MTHDSIAMIQAMIDNPDDSEGAPPYVKRMGFDSNITFTRVAPGEFDLEWHVDAQLCHSDGFVQGGIVVVVADVGQSFAFWTTSGSPEAYSTADFHTRFLRPISSGSVMLVTSRVANRSRRTAAVETRFVDTASGKLHAIVSGGWVVTDRKLE